MFVVHMLYKPETLVSLLTGVSLPYTLLTTDFITESKEETMKLLNTLTTSKSQKQSHFKNVKYTIM